VELFSTVNMSVSNVQLYHRVAIATTAFADDCR
jgi:hypothetical protein